MYKSICLSLLLFFFLIGCGNDSSDSYYPLRKKATQAYVNFQNQLYELAVSGNPELKEVMSISRDLQITWTQRNDMRYYFLCNNHPDRIHPETHDDILNFEWTEDDEKTLLSNSKEYSQLTKKFDALHTKNQGNTDWPQAHQLFKDKINNDQRFLQLQDNLNKIMKEIDEEIKNRQKK